MKTAIKWISIVILIVCFLYIFSGCSEEDSNDLSGRYNFIEPPHPISRDNRLDNSQVAFDVIFSINNSNELTEVDLVLSAEEIQNETGSISGRDIIFEGGGGTITIRSVRKLGQTLQASGASFTMGSETKTFGALQIDPY